MKQVELVADLFVQIQNRYIRIKSYNSCNSYNSYNSYNLTTTLRLYQLTRRVASMQRSLGNVAIPKQDSRFYSSFYRGIISS